ncbi:helix-turn-helix domain-containing protein [Archangium lipolyticum]|uniref:helix-turn-helix domain-containing protein n=1 Tax=Archangium lipolyticum TaxID=2970465 RepID=UPI002149E178|nr:helix-turn-helix domain-containing protein [Archangium lipolyticum]
MSAMKHFEQQSYYELLEVPVTASEDQILDAYARAMETYSPDSIAVYSLVDPDQLESLRQRLSQALEVLSELDRRLEYDRKIGVTRSDEELARLRAESLKRAAGSSEERKPANGAGEPPAAVAAPAEPPGVKPTGATGAQAVVAEPVEEEPVIELEAVAEESPSTGKEPAPEPPAPEVHVAPPSVGTPPVAQEASVMPPAPAEPVPPAPEQPAASRPAAVAPQGPRPAIHSRPARPGSVVPPPLPPRNGGLRPPIATRAEAGAQPTPVQPAPERARGVIRPPPGQQLGDAPVLSQAAAIATAESALAQVAVKARDSRTRLKTVVDIPSDAEFNGELLRRVREGRNISLQMLADRTRISTRHVESIEADRYDSLPASVYLRGMLMSIARELGLDPLRVSRSYMTLVASGEKNRR